MIENIKPAMTIGIGEHIKEELKCRKWTLKHFSKISNIDIKTLTALINNKTILTPDIAEKSSKVFGQSPQFWLNLDENLRKRFS